jgi:hypothetical protein
VDRALLLHLQRQALQYFLDNQASNGLMLDRQRNHGPRQSSGACSTAATGMGLIALAVASAPPLQLLSHAAAVARIRTCLQSVCTVVPHDQGIVPHFLDAVTGAVLGIDAFSTIDTAWLLVGALWAAAFLRDAQLEDLAAHLYGRVGWRYWSSPDGLLRHGKGRDGRFLPCCWDRLNGETVFLYVLAAGATEEQALPAGAWSALRPFYGTVAGLRFNNADLGLFVFQYGLDLLDLRRWRAPGPVDLATEAQVAALANYRACRGAAATYATFRRYWGLSAGDGPGQPPERDTYRCYAPRGPIDGTAHLTATLASVAHLPAQVLHNLHEARHERRGLRGRYGFSNVNVDRGWVGTDMVGIDAGAAVLALDNFLHANRVRHIFHGLPCIRRGLQRLGLVATSDAFASPEFREPPMRRAS